MDDAERLALLETICRELIAAQDDLNASTHYIDVRDAGRRRDAAFLEMRAALDSGSVPGPGTEQGGA